MLIQRPYAEYEDTISVIQELKRSATANDQVWVNHDAVPAFQFYMQKKDPRFAYGNFHRTPQDYIPEVLASIDPHSDRLWLVFSHLQQASDRAEERVIVNSLRPSWAVYRVVAPTNASLYLAHRKESP